MTFPCTQCGLCCKQMDKVLSNPTPFDWMQELVDDFPYQALSNGHCEMLHNNQCMVYEDRPLLCNLERTVDELDIGFTKDQWFALNERGCEILQDKALALRIN